MTSSRRYFDGFDGYDSMVAEFMDAGWDYAERKQKTVGLPKDFPRDHDVLFAAYGTEEAYSGDAVVVFRRGADLMLVTGGHCSCNGLEGQWTPEVTTIAELKHQNCGPTESEGGTRSYSEYTAEARAGFKALIEQLEVEAQP